MASYTPMIQQYLAIKAEYQDAFLFFRLGDFYEMFFDDAKEAARILEITLTSRDGGSEHKVPMCGVPYHSAEVYITRLIENGFKVAICEQTEDPKEAKGVVKREVVRVVTPGTVMEGKLLDEKGNNYIASVYLEGNQFGVSVADISTGEFYATELTGLSFESVLNELNQYNPSEVLINDSLNYAFESEIIQYKATITLAKAESFAEYSNKVNQQFKNIYTLDISAIITSSVGQLLFYLERTQQKHLSHFNDLTIYDANQYMVLDTYSKRNLELTLTSREQIKKGSLLWLLDNTATAMGSRLLKRWIEKPLLSEQSINQRLNIVEELYSNPILLEELNTELKNIYDIERVVSRVSYGNATPRDLNNLKGSLEKIPSIHQIIMNSSSHALKELIKEIDLCDDITLLIDNSIQEDAPISTKVGGIIKRGYDKQLDIYYHANTEGKEWLQDLERREKEITGIKSLKVGYNKVFGYYIEITKSNLAQAPVDRYIRKQTLANAERYITEELKDKEEIIIEAEEKTIDLEYQLFTQIRESIALQNHRLQKLSQLVAQIDVLISFAIISIKNKYKRPQLNHDGIIQIIEGRHPVIEAIHKDDTFIPNDVHLDRNTDQILMITGPNMAGKSTYMRQVALTVILAQIGCFVPAREANLAIIDRIFTRIGAGDDLTSGQSTFMVEMLETKNAVTQATPNSLILLDEIGRGTSTYDGMALAQSIIQYIHEHVNAITLFSTHYHELTSLADSFPRINNIHVNVIEKDGKVIFLHKIEKGKADKSYGIHVAELAGMPTAIIEDAKKILEILEQKAKNSEGNQQLQLEFFQSSQSIAKHDNNPDKNIDRSSKQLLKRIEELDLLNMTPMEAFQILFDIQKQLRK